MLKENKTLLLILALFFYVSFCNAQTVSRYDKISPKPVKVHNLKGEFILDQNTVIQPEISQDQNAIFLRDYIKRTLGIEIHLNAKRREDTRQGVIIFSNKDSNLPKGGYRISVTPDTITLIGNDTGLFYAVQSLMQILPVTLSDSVSIPCVQLEDYPRFGYRGLMLDVSRHFFTVKEVKNLLDLMALYKLNIFHWHLTDDQGWRIEIKSLPKLTEVGAWRVPRYGRFGTNERPRKGERATDGGFYTQEEIRDVVQYASDRHIQILPEIDVPGHAMAIIASYPELSVTRDTSIKVNPGAKYGRWTKERKLEMLVENTLNPTDEEVYEFLDKVFTEVASLFPYEYIHTGGDECYKGFWERDLEVNDFMRKHNINNYNELQAYFTTRVNEILKSKNKKLVGWDEITDGELAGGVTVMNRFGRNTVLEQINKGHNVIMAQGNQGLYYDYPQSESDMEPISHGYSSPVWKSYMYDPLANLKYEQQTSVLGVEGCIWTEHIATVSKLQYMLLPRLLSLSEISWGDAKNKDLQFFIESTLPYHLARFEALGYNYWVPPVMNTIDTVMYGEKFTFDFKAPVERSKIYFTVNGKIPGETDKEYIGPLSFTIGDNKSQVLQTIVITPQGRRSVVSRIVMENSKDCETD